MFALEDVTIRFTKLEVCVAVGLGGVLWVFNLI